MQKRKRVAVTGVSKFMLRAWGDLDGQAFREESEKNRVERPFSFELIRLGR